MKELLLRGGIGGSVSCSSANLVSSSGDGIVGVATGSGFWLELSPALYICSFLLCFRPLLVLVPHRREIIAEKT